MPPTFWSDTFLVNINHAKDGVDHLPHIVDRFVTGWNVDEMDSKGNLLEASLLRVLVSVPYLGGKQGVRNEIRSAVPRQTPEFITLESEDVVVVGGGSFLDVMVAKAKLLPRMSAGVNHRIVLHWFAADTLSNQVQRAFLLPCPIRSFGWFV